MSFFVQRSDVSEFRKRFRWIALGMALIFIALAVRLFELQLLEGEDYRAIARENVVRKVTLATTRGIIRDRTGKVLAASRPAYNVYVVPSKLDMEKTWQKLVDYLALGIDEQKRLEEKIGNLKKDEGPRSHQQILLKEDISRDAVANLATHEAELPAVQVVPVPVRYYPFAEVGAHVLGYMAEVDSDKLAQLRSSGYIEGDRIGATGVERAWESYLRGTRGWEKVLVDANGRRYSAGEGRLGATARSDIIEEPRRSDPIPGRDLRLTLDADIQKAMDKAFRGELAGGAVLVDVRTGRILGLYSKPSFDPNALSGGSGKQVIADAFRRLNGDPLHPGLDKTVSGAYPPGSTFKPFTALAALEKGLIDKKVMIQCKGFITFGKRTFRCTHVHGTVEIHKAIAESCNVYFFTLAKEYGVSMDLIAEMGQRYGFGQKTGLGVNAEAGGRMPTKAWMTLEARLGADVRLGGVWSPGQRRKNELIYWLVRFAIGVAARAPRALVRGVVAAFAFLAWALGGSLRARVGARLALGLDREVEPREVRDAFDATGAAIASMATLFRSDEAAAASLELDEVSAAAFRGALEEGRGVVYVTAHLGPWGADGGAPRRARLPGLATGRARATTHGSRRASMSGSGRRAAFALDLPRRGWRRDPRRARALARRCGGLPRRPPIARGPVARGAALRRDRAGSRRAGARLALALGAAVVVGTAAPAARSSFAASRCDDLAPGEDGERALTRRIAAELDRRIREAPAAWLGLWSRGESSLRDLIAPQELNPSEDPR